MAFGRLFISKWLKSLTFFPKPREAKEKLLPIYENNWIDPEKYTKFKSSDLSELWTDDSILTVNTSMINTNNHWNVVPQDHPMEVFLDDDGNIKEPLNEGIASCTIDRWYMPDCIPGIQSTVDISSVDGFSKLDVNRRQWPKTITVLFANDRYIQLAPNKVLFYIEPEDDYYSIVEAHFTKRGIDHLSEGTASSFKHDQIDYIQNIWKNHNGQGSNKTSSSSTGTFGWELKNSKINIDRSQIASGLPVNAVTCSSNTFIQATWTET